MRSREVDAYIAKAPEYARPILTKIREAFHKASPDIVETIKWSTPHFEYQGVLGGMAAFKERVALGFWKASLMSDPEGILEQIGDSGMSRLHASGVSDLPSEKVLRAYIREAMALNEKGVKVEKKPKTAKKPLEVPDDLAAALKKNAKARTNFEAFSPSHRREYIEWITDAKQEATRAKRLATAIQWIAAGKSRNWKYK